MLKKYLLVVALVFSFTIAPTVSADTASDLQAQINTILAQIRQLQAQLNAQTGGSSTVAAPVIPSVSSGGGGSSTTNGFCYNWTRNLRVGDAGADVRALAQALVKEGITTEDRVHASIDEEIASWVVEFQEKYASEILTPNNLRRGNGYVGPSTRAKLNALYGCARPTPVTAYPTPVTQPSITVQVPAFGAVLDTGFQYKIVWTDTREKGVNPLYVIWMAGSNGKDLIAQNVSGSTYCNGTQCVFGWTTPTVGSTQNQISIYDMANDPNATVVGRSGYFNITAVANTTQPSITVTSPTSGTTVGKVFATSGQCPNYHGNVSVYYYYNQKITKDVPCVNGQWTTSVNLETNAGSGSFTLYAMLSSGQEARVDLPFVISQTQPSISSQSSETVATKEAVANYYRELLKREPEAGGVEYWMNTRMSLEKVKQGIIASYEYGVKKQINDLYRSLLNREPEVSSLTYWYGKVYTDRWTIDQVKYGIITSSEYTNRNIVSALTVQPSISVTSPRGGETYQTTLAGGVSGIIIAQWKTSNIPANAQVNLEFFKGNPDVGATLVKRIATNNDGYEPLYLTGDLLQALTPGNDYWFHVSYGDYFGKSDYSFTVTAPMSSAQFDYTLSTNGDITITQNPSSNSQGSNTVTINKTGGTATAVAMFASGLPSGATSMLTNNPCIPNTTCAGTLTIYTSPNTPTGSYPITVTGVVNGTSVNQNRTATFSLIVKPVSSTQPSITVTAPTFGQTIEGKAGTSFNVQWTTQNWSSDTLVNIDTIYSDGSVIRARSLSGPNVNGIVNTATININTNATERKTLRMRVSAAKSGTLAAGEEGYSGYFTITPASTAAVQPSIMSVAPLSAPVGGRITVSGKNFGSSGNLVITTMDGTKTYLWMIGASPVTYDQANQTITFTVPSQIGRGVHPDGWWNEPIVDVVPGTYKLYVSILDGSNNFVRSNIVEFSVSGGTARPSITVVSPNGGETYKVGDSMDISWGNYSGTEPLSIALQTTASNGATSARILASNISASSQSYRWTVESLDVTARYKIEVYPATGRELVGRSSNYFTITAPAAPTQPSITVVSPNSGTWAIGSQQTVTVRTEIIPSNIVPSAYLKNVDTGVFLEGVAFAALDSTNRTLTITIPSTVSVGRYYVEARVWYEGQWYSDQSDGVITVTAPTVSAAVTASQMANTLESVRVILENMKARLR